MIVAGQCSSGVALSWEVSDSFGYMMSIECWGCHLWKQLDTALCPLHLCVPKDFAHQCIRAN